MAQNSSSLIRFVAVVGTLVIVGLIAINLVFKAGGLIPGDAATGPWHATQSLARILLPLVAFSYLFLFHRGLLPTLEASSRALAVSTAFVLGLALAATLDPWIAARLADTRFEFVPNLAEPLVGFCLAVLVFLPKSLRDLVLKDLSTPDRDSKTVTPDAGTVAPAEAALAERVLSFYFGLLMGLLSYLVVVGTFRDDEPAPPTASAAVEVRVAAPDQLYEPSSLISSTKAL